MSEILSTSLVLGKSIALLRGAAARAAIALTAMSTPGIVIDSGLVSQSNAGAFNLIQTAVTTAASYWLTKALLQEIAGRRLPPRFPAFFALGLLSELAILVGTVAFILPGIFFFVRWSLSSPILLSREESVTEAMRQSWHKTTGYFWPVLGALLALYGPGFALGILAFGLNDALSGNFGLVILANAALNAGLIAGWHGSVAIYVLLGAPDPLAETFG